MKKKIKIIEDKSPLSDLSFDSFQSVKSLNRNKKTVLNLSKFHRKPPKRACTVMLFSDKDYKKTEINNKNENNLNNQENLEKLKIKCRALKKKIKFLEIENKSLFEDLKELKDSQNPNTKKFKENFDFLKQENLK